MTKLYLCGITCAGNEANLRALFEPMGEGAQGIIDFFDGAIWTFHYPTDAGATYLESRKGEGRVVYAHFSKRHGSSMTQYLHQGPMEDGDFFIQIDDKERLGFDFCQNKLPQILDQMKERNIAMVANFGKGLIFRYNEQLEFKGSPHWYASGLDGNSSNIELPLTDFWNMRNQQRDEYQWVNHYCKYYIYPAGSNHCLLGLEKQGDPQKLFGPREANRLAFRQELKKRGFEMTLDGVSKMLGSPIDDTLRHFINADKIVNDYYRYHILGDKTVVHSHLPSDMKQIN